MYNYFKRFVTVLLILVLFVSLTGCNSDTDVGTPETPSNGNESTEPKAPSESKDPIRLGFFAPITGPAAADGLSTSNSAELAVSIINEQGGINGRPVELVKYDDHFDTKEAVNIAQKLTTRDNVVAVVSGSYSGPTRVAAPIFQEAGVPMLSSYAVHPEVTGAGDYVFSQSFAGEVQGRAGASIALEAGAKKISIIAVDNDFGMELSESFTEYATTHGAEIVSVDKVAMSDTEFTPIITKLKEEVKPDFIYMANYYAHGAEVMRQINNMRIDVPVLATQGIDSHQFLEIAGENAEGLILTTNMNRDSVSSGTQEYIKSYIEKYNIIPDMVGASAYDSFQVLFKVIGEVGTDKEAIRDGIRNLTNFETVTGLLIEYAPSRGAIKPMQIQIIKDGEFHFYGEITDPDIITPIQN